LSYQIIDLGTLPGGSYSTAYGINDSGQVVGISSGFTSPYHAFLWEATNGMQDLGTLPGDHFSWALGINDSGQVVGFSYRSLGNGIIGHTFLWDATNGMQDLGTLPGGTSSYGKGINHSGQVVGISAIAGNQSSHAFLWDAVNGMQDLGTLPGESESEASGINDSGQVVGDSTGLGALGRAFLWDATNGMQDLGTLPGDPFGEARGINNSGQVVGFSFSGGDDRHAFLWDAVHGMQNLGTLGRSAFATGINSNGQVVGASERFDPIDNDFVYHAFVWQNGALSDLNDLILPGSGWSLSFASGINSAGQIVGQGIHNGKIRAFLLTPDSSALPAPAGTVHFTSSDAQAVLLADYTVTAADAGVHPFSLTLATLGDQTLNGTDSADATCIDRATVTGTSDAAAPAGPTVQNATDAVFVRSHRTQTAIPWAAWEVEGSELGLTALQSP
jgi:probable HAF family extracellular repeat protein